MYINKEHVEIKSIIDTNGTIPALEYLCETHGKCHASGTEAHNTLHQHRSC